MIRNTPDSNQIARDYLDSILIEQRLIGSQTPSTQFELFGQRFSTPVMMPAFSHLKPYAPGRESGLIEYSRGAKDANAVNFVGMIENEGFLQIVKANPNTIRIVKPYADREKIFSQLTFAEQEGALAVGMDIDHFFNKTNGQWDLCVGELLQPQSEEMLKENISSVKIPFVVKGVLSVKDAAVCAEAGADAVIVSHHHGRLNYAVPPLMVLPDICRELKGTGIRIFADCSIDTGYDAFKAIALGADAVCVGRALLPDLKKDGAVGTKRCLDRMTGELAAAMAFTGAKCLSQITADVLWSSITGKRIVPSDTDSR